MDPRKLFEIRNISKLIACVLGVFLCLRYAAECSEGIRKGILFCIEVLVPSLFVFMALSSFLINSNVLFRLNRPLEVISRLLFRLPGASAAVILLCILGGYPVGAHCAAMLQKRGQLSRSEAEKTVCIAVCAGPGFLLNYVGGALLNNRRAGMILLAAQIAGMTLTGILIGRMIPSDPDRQRKSVLSQPGGLLLSSVSDASRATARLCGIVILCAALTEVTAAVSPSVALTDLTAAAIEITTGCHRMCGQYPLVLIGFFIGFGGISVHLQIAAGAEGLLTRKSLFFLFRILQGIFTAAATYILLLIFPVGQSVFNSTDAPLTASKSATLVGSAALILCSLCFLGSMRQKRA